MDDKPHDELPVAEPVRLKVDGEDVLVPRWFVVNLDQAHEGLDWPSDPPAEPE